MQPNTSPLTADLERLARKRARAKLGWYLHACVYVLVNLFLAYLSSRHSTHWAIFPAAGWGLGLLIHGAAVWIALPCSAFPCSTPLQPSISSGIRTAFRATRVCFTCRARWRWCLLTWRREFSAQ